MTNNPTTTIRLGILGTGNKDLRSGIIGLGNMGSLHARSVLEGKVPRMRLTAVCDINPERMVYDPEIKTFTDSRALIRSGEVDAVLIATPHYSHTDIGIDALENGLHTLIEKPISVHKADCERLIAAYAKTSGVVFAAMFNQRTDPFHQKIRALLQGGELGEIRRVSWTITNWFRSESYYASGGWRATWAGEGGGVLLNQCPHNLDLFQWFFGLPRQVRAFCSFGRYHDIEVEDDVTAYMNFENGATAVFITSTGEAPGTNRLEIAAERGRLVYEDDELRFTRNEIEISEFSRTTKQSFATPPVWNVQIPLGKDHGEQHIGILGNFTAAILDGTRLIAPATEGFHSVELANAFLYSSLTNTTVNMPLDGKVYEQELRKLIAGSRAKKSAPTVSTATDDFAKSSR
jgi:predicted dehydrogenase